MSLQSTARCTSPSFIAAARSSTRRDCHQCALAQLGVFVCRSVLFNLAGGDLAYIYRLVANWKLRPGRIGISSGAAARVLTRLHSLWALSRWLHLRSRNPYRCFAVLLCMDFHVHIQC